MDPLSSKIVKVFLLSQRKKGIKKKLFTKQKEVIIWKLQAREPRNYKLSKTLSIVNNQKWKKIPRIVLCSLKKGEKRSSALRRGLTNIMNSKHSRSFWVVVKDFLRLTGSMESLESMMLKMETHKSFTSHRDKRRSVCRPKKMLSMIVERDTYHWVWVQAIKYLLGVILSREIHHCTKTTLLTWQ